MFPLLVVALCYVIAVCSSSPFSRVNARWLGPYDTHDEHSLWLRTQMEKTPQRDFIRVHDESADGFNILDFNAIPFVNTVEASLQNGRAVYDATVAANSSVSRSRTVIIPTNYNFWIIPLRALGNVMNVTFQFGGNLSCNPNNFTAWPMYATSGGKLPLFQFEYGRDIVFVGTGTGSIDGHGFLWWEQEFNPKTFDAHRPNLVQFDHTIHIVIDSLTLYNSPRYHIYANPGYAVLMQHIKIEVSIFDQYFLHKKHGTLLHEGIDWITFPLNTDGIDMHGNSMVVRNCHVENFDDSYCPKPWGLNTPEGTTHNILVENCSIHYGVGASIGSVPPSSAINTVENVTFSRIYWKNCLKCIYVKPNPGNSGYGLIRDIAYKNSLGETPLWWSAYLGVQQQDQPGGSSDTGCSFFYPLPGQQCQTQPRVPMQNIYLDNVTFTDALLSPGMMRCNDTYEGPNSGPCSGWVWNNVVATSITKWPFGENWLCHALENPVFSNVYPSCISQVPTRLAPAAAAALSTTGSYRRLSQGNQQGLLQSLFDRRKNFHRQQLSDEALSMLDDLALILKQRGFSLLGEMKKLRDRKK